MLVDVIDTLTCHLVTYLRDPRARKANVFTLTFICASRNLAGFMVYICSFTKFYGHKNIMEGETSNWKLKIFRFTVTNTFTSSSCFFMSGFVGISGFFNNIL